MQNRGGVGDAEDYLTTLFIHLGYSRIGVGTSRGAGTSSAAYSEAAAAFETALRWRPGDADANLGLGWVRLESGLLADAERHLRAALAADPDRADAMRLLALTLERQGKHAEAREYWRMWQNAVERASTVQMGLQTNR